MIPTVILAFLMQFPAPMSADLCRTKRLFGSLAGRIYWTTTYRCRVGVLQFVGSEESDDALRFSSELIQVRTGLDFEERLRRDSDDPSDLFESQNIR
jgi:hypothetical protein